MSKEVAKWVDGAMYEAEPLAKEIDVKVVSATTDPLGIVAHVCKMYEGHASYSKTDLTDGERAHYLSEMTKTKLQAPLEFVDLHFLISGVTRAFTHQMVRQRTAVYAQESLRFAVKENFAMETPLPPSLRHRKDDDPLVVLWKAHMNDTEDAYNLMIAAGLPAEDARGLLPHQTTTRLHYKTNLRNFISTIGTRICTQAQFEWREVAFKMMQAMRDIDIPYGDQWQWKAITDPKNNWFVPSCYQEGRCPFKAGFDRGCTIRDRADTGQFDKIDVAEWAADPTAAYVTKKG